MNLVHPKSMVPDGSPEWEPFAPYDLRVPLRAQGFNFDAQTMGTLFHYVLGDVRHPFHQRTRRHRLSAVYTLIRTGNARMMAQNALAQVILNAKADPAVAQTLTAGSLKDAVLGKAAEIMRYWIATAFCRGDLEIATTVIHDIDGFRWLLEEAMVAALDHWPPVPGQGTADIALYAKHVAWCLHPADVAAWRTLPDHLRVVLVTGE